ncbi:hypothetical protein [Pseudoteredinibacter isoporae]|uniref:hypothetical protein n=1 Tax=Pseudoteredinibacter isoporae TaxID=570281 RepID=UPI00310A6D88
MLKQIRNRLSPFIFSLCLLVTLAAAPGLSLAQADKKQKPQQEQRDESDKKSKKGKRKKKTQSDNTIWLEEKLNPGTQWLEKAVKPLTRWIEDQVQLAPKEHKGRASNRQERPQNNKPRPGNNLTPNNPGTRLSEADIRRLLAQRYSANILHIKALGQGQQKRYRVKLINQEGVIQILYLSAINGEEIPR